MFAKSDVEFCKCSSRTQHAGVHGIQAQDLGIMSLALPLSYACLQIPRRNAAKKMKKYKRNWTLLYYISKSIFPTTHFLRSHQVNAYQFEFHDIIFVLILNPALLLNLIPGLRINPTQDSHLCFYCVYSSIIVCNLYCIMHSNCELLNIEKMHWIITI